MSIDTSFKVKNGLEVPSMNTMLASNVVMPTIKPSLNFNFMKSEYLDPRITFTRNSIATRINSNGILETVSANTPRFDYDVTTGACKGLLIEDARTNYIRNNTMVGAVTGTPGTIPTNWTVFGTGITGVTRQIQGTGVEDGVSYIDIRFFGTVDAVANPEIYIQCDSVAASIGQTYTSSIYAKIVSGTLNGITGGQHFLIGLNSSLVVTESPFTAFLYSLSAGSLLNNRYVRTTTLANAATVTVHGRLDVNLTASAVIDFTIRVGMSQLELGGFVTSVIPTSGTAVTRAADSASVSVLTPWFNPVEGTLFAEAMLENTQVGAPTNRYPGAAALNDGTLNNAVHLYFDINPSTSTRVSGQEIFVGGSSQIVGVYSTVLDNTPIRQAVAYKQSSSVGSAKGLIGSVAGAANVPVVNRLLLGANRGYSPLNGYLQRVSYYPARLTATELQALTA